MVPGVVHRWCGSRASSCSECGWVQCFFSLSSFFRFTFSLKVKFLDENVCACELAVHFGWASARPPCQPPPARGRPRSGSLLAGATYTKAEGYARK